MSQSEVREVIDKWAEINTDLGKKYTWVQVRFFKQRVWRFEYFCLCLVLLDKFSCAETDAFLHVYSFSDL